MPPLHGHCYLHLVSADLQHRALQPPLLLLAVAAISHGGIACVRLASAAVLPAPAATSFIIVIFIVLRERG
jgi:hypothetical protein